ncbi:hypothetical protein BCV69DRAFT_268419 [Microstroma glucosiphilum]|uniref:CHK kinase-like domain-containing protein n=1 Tax=Pseudomicrostroma glucosiphilum TaxID=1684307 RepID=A0A316U9M1_9BASI|nr:hypothetical protein BCV69DRAFT_268419 [Pseudomicrostroma glucosiphilum]PWN21862.1 hypothetical protein BCV69DRAFT_268419 [Pseudomicrostroma glucosiphilum]
MPRNKRLSSSPQLFAAIAALLPPAYANHLDHVEHLTTLWAGYGNIYRLHFASGEEAEEVPSSAVLKWIEPPPSAGEEDEDEEEQEGTMRKVLSYKVEANFYSNLSPKFSSEHHGTPKFLARPTPFTLLLSDLAAEYELMPTGRQDLTLEQALAGLDAIARLHACFWNYTVQEGRECHEPREEMRVLRSGQQGWQGDGVWKWGTYNYLQTRQPGLQQIDDRSPFAIFKKDPDLAWAIEDAIQNPEGGVGLTLVHGDAKAENMAFHRVATHRVALYDFQYIGVGVPTQDLIKYLCCVVPSRHLSSQADERAWLSFYHSRLAEHLESYASERGRAPPSTDLQQEYPLKRLLEDFDLSLLSWVRFTEGWGGGAWGNVRWLHRRARALLEEPNGQQWLKGIRSRWTQKQQSGK